MSDCECNVNYYYLDSYSWNTNPLTFVSNSLTYDVTINESFVLQICEAACYTINGANEGHTCAKVYFKYEKHDKTFTNRY